MPRDGDQAAERKQVGRVKRVHPKEQQQRLEDRLQELLQQLTEQAQANVILRARESHQESAIQLLEQELKRLSDEHSQQGSGAHGAVALSQIPCSLGLHEGGQTTTVSVHALPDPSAWDRSWEAQVKAMRTIDLVVLHRQWLQEMAMMLPKAQLRGVGSPPYLRLQSLMDRYTWFNENAMMLAPDAWGKRSSYDLEALQPVERPSLEFFKEVFGRRENNQKTAAHFREYVAASRKLRAEFDALAAQQRTVLALEGSTAAGADATGRHWSGARRGVGGKDGRAAWGDRQPHTTAAAGSTQRDARAQGSGSGQLMLAGEGRLLAADMLMAKMEGNLWRQRMALRQCLHAVWRDLRATSSMDVAGAYLTIYPLPLDAVDFLDMIEGGGVRVPPPVAARAAVNTAKQV